MTFGAPEIATYYRVRIPALIQRGCQWRGPCPVHGGKQSNFSADPKTGRSYCFSQCGQGWDIVGLEMTLTGARYADAIREIGAIIGRDLITDRPRQSSAPKYSERELCRAELLAVGLSWRLDRVLVAAKRELLGPRHDDAVRVVRSLTDWQERINGWQHLRLNGPVSDPRSYWESAWSANGQQEAVKVLQQLPSKLTRECIAEAREAQEIFARTICALGCAA